MVWVIFFPDCVCVSREKYIMRLIIIKIHFIQQIHTGIYVLVNNFIWISLSKLKGDHKRFWVSHISPNYISQ